MSPLGGPWDTGHADARIVSQHLPPDDDGRKPVLPPQKPKDAARSVRRALSEFDPEIDVVRESHEALDALVAEDARLRGALEEIDVFIRDLAYPGPETNWIHAIVRVALTGKEAIA